MWEKQGGVGGVCDCWKLEENVWKSSGGGAWRGWGWKSGWAERKILGVECGGLEGERRSVGRDMGV